MADIWGNRRPRKPGHFVVEFFSKALFLFFFFLLFFFFAAVFHQDLAFLFAAPLCAPHPPSCPHYRELGPGHWPWTLTLPVISHIPGPFPPLRPQTARCSSPSPPPSPPLPPFLSLSPCFFFPPFSLSLDTGRPRWLSMGRRSETTESKHGLGSRTTGPRPHCQPLPWPMALSINLWNDLELMSKWWCQPVSVGQLGFAARVRRADSGHSPPKTLIQTFWPFFPLPSLHGSLVARLCCCILMCGLNLFCSSAPRLEKSLKPWVKICPINP